MDVQDSSSAFAPVAFDVVVLVHVPNPVQPQQSQASSSSQAATLPSSSAPPLSTPSCCDTSSTYSHVVLSSPSVLIEFTTPPSSISSSASPKRISRAGSNFRVDPLLRVANVPVMLRPAKVVSPGRLSSVEESLSASKRSKPSKTYSSRDTRGLVVLKISSF